MKVVEGTVEQVHVDRAKFAFRDVDKYRPSSDCPLAQSIRELLGDNFLVGTEHVTYSENDTVIHSYALDEASVAYARTWDLRREAAVPFVYCLKEVL